MLHFGFANLHIMDWDNLRYFLELARTGTLAAAARRSAHERYGRELMNQRYEALFLELAGQAAVA